jgi:hypothetical protein
LKQTGIHALEEAVGDPKEAVGEAVGVSAFFFFTTSLGEAVGVLLPP